MKETTKDANKDFSSLLLSLSEKQPLVFYQEVTRIRIHPLKTK